jgi:hypothetical protein
MHYSIQIVHNHARKRVGKAHWTKRSAFAALDWQLTYGVQNEQINCVFEACRSIHITVCETCRSIHITVCETQLDIVITSFNIQIINIWGSSLWVNNFRWGSQIGCSCTIVHFPQFKDSLVRRRQQFSVSAKTANYLGLQFQTNRQTVGHRCYSTAWYSLVYVTIGTCQ